MTRKSYPRFATCLALLWALVLAFVASASAEWKEKVLYSFQGGTDGYQPAGGVVFDKQGNLYGATTNGGSSSCRGPFQCGTVFQLKPPTKSGDPWTETVLYVFKGSDSNDGASPFGGLIWDQAGNLYGTTGYDGTGDCMLLGSRVGCGTVYELSPPIQKGGAWTETVIYDFKGNTDGQLPTGDLVFDKQGNLYGATEYGGGYGSCNPSFYQHCGTIFKLSPPKTKGGKWTEKVLHGFKGGSDGANPNGGLIFDSKGAIYGTTLAGGNQNCKYDASVGCGTAFELESPSEKTEVWKEEQIHVFSGRSDGAQPNGGLILDAKGSLYGAAGGGNPTGGGIAFELTTDGGGGWKEIVLHWFSNNGPGAFTAGLIFDSFGNLYGPTAEGARFRGTVVRLKRPVIEGGKWTPTVLYTFQGIPDGSNPAASLTFDASRNLYSTTAGGGNSAGDGTVFEVEPW